MTAQEDVKGKMNMCVMSMKLVSLEHRCFVNTHLHVLAHIWFSIQNSITVQLIMNCIESIPCASADEVLHIRNCSTVLVCTLYH